MKSLLVRMSFITLQVGQCGNQLGQSFFNALSEITSQNPTTVNCNFLEESRNRFFCDDEKSEKHIARAILIDTEPKVIKGISTYHKNNVWVYRDGCHVSTQQLGAGNNWAMGYHCHGPIMKESILTSIQKEVERCDYVQGFLLFSSVAGGTGSGLGSYLSEVLQDEFPSISSACIKSYRSQSIDHLLWYCGTF